MRVQALTSLLTSAQLKLYPKSVLKKLVSARDKLAQDKAMMQLFKTPWPRCQVNILPAAEL